MNEVLAGPVLAANEMSAGTAGLLTVVLLCVASGFIFYFMSGSLKRMRGHVEDGDFAAANAHRLAATAGEGEPAEVSQAQAVAIPAQSAGTPPDA
ncbi:hypothetical protein [Pseudofrankia sp. DC12]|uniref:hypothetical protein n=1 Tax=Pseudofrankia sp. DC12 TaxID=683315 RepID=UPI0005F87DEA|nr:hypothetical protein [Pseudofrankia sp. DC12]